MCLKCLEKLLDFHKFRDDFFTNIKLYAVKIEEILEDDSSAIKIEEAGSAGNYDCDTSVNMDNDESMDFEPQPTNEQYTVTADGINEVVDVKIENDGEFHTTYKIDKTLEILTESSIDPLEQKKTKTRDRGKNCVERKAKKDYFCDVCGKTFNTTYYTFTYHQRIHDPDSPFVCKYCGKRFPVPNDLHKHLKIHTGEKPYVCYICGHRSASEYLEKVKTLVFIDKLKVFKTIMN